MESMKTAKTMISTLGLGLVLMLSGQASAQEKTIPIVITTELGVIKAELYPERAPITVANFLANIDAGLYQEGHFYRALNKSSGPLGPLALIQGGKASSRESRPPIVHETTAISGLSHTDGVLSMARLAPGTASSDFFISSGDNTGLDTIESDLERQGYAAFGRVTEGMDIVRHILSQPVGHRASDDPVVVSLREKNLEVLISSLLDQMIPLQIERVNQEAPL